MKNQVLVKKYAQGFVQALKDEAEFEAARADLLAFIGLVEGNAELRSALASPFIGARAKALVLQDVLAKTRVSDKTARLLSLLLDHKRFELLKDIADVLPEKWNEKLGVLTFEVASVVPLTEAQMNRLRETLEAVEKKPVSLVFKIDPEIVGGLALKRGHIVYDLSIEGSLNQMKEEIQQG
jgi:F-type H+-transporting ATPase subunit delta